ncbi:MAG: hypothetical protein HYZ24_04240 [Chloroflexi bacterium]|nr:hypothetical protein [Chloroflexota bacterium]
METAKFLITPVPSLNLQEEFAGVVARAVVEPGRDIESLRGRNSAFEPREAGLAICGSQVNGLFESLLHEAFNG